MSTVSRSINDYQFTGELIIACELCALAAFAYVCNLHAYTSVKLGFIALTLITFLVYRGGVSDSFARRDITRLPLRIDRSVDRRYIFVIERVRRVRNRSHSVSIGIGTIKFRLRTTNLKKRCSL